VQVLDADTRGKVYYFVEKVTPGAQTPAQVWGQVVYEDAGQILLSIVKGDEHAFLEAAAALPLHLQLLTSQTLVLDIQAFPATGVKPTDVANPAIVALLAQVAQGRLSDLMADLSGERNVTIGGRSVNLKTRYTFSGQINDALQYVRESFARMGLSPQDSGWSYGRYSGVNIIADLRGTTTPDRIWVIGGHLDDTSQSPYTRAPGADDNGSGMAAMLVIADIMRQHRWRDTIRFVAFTGEEQGMWGSKSYAARLRSAGAQVAGYIDLDMIGWDGNDDRVIELHSGTRQGSIDLANAFISANNRYATGLVVELKQGTASRFSDHSSFWDNGYSAFLGIENFFVDSRAADRNPYYHNTGDLLSRTRLSYIARYTQAALATLAELAGLMVSASPTATATVTSTPGSAASPTAATTRTSTVASTTSPTSTATATATATSASSPSATMTRTSTPAGAPSLTATPTATSTATAAPSPSATATATPVTCRNLMPNGDMEAASGWRFGTTARPAGYVTGPVAEGARSLRTGIVLPTSDRRTYSTAYQSVSIPANASSAILTARLWRGTQDGAGDRQELLLLNSRYGLLRILQRGLGGDGAWQAARFDLTSHRGQTVVVYFNTYNDGDGRRSWMHVDDVRLDVCTP
jgi:hypothetical protein